MLRKRPPRAFPTIPKCMSGNSECDATYTAVLGSVAFLVWLCLYMVLRNTFQVYRAAHLMFEIEVSSLRRKNDLLQDPYRRGLHRKGADTQSCCTTSPNECNKPWTQKHGAQNPRVSTQSPKLQPLKQIISPNSQCSNAKGSHSQIQVLHPQPDTLNLSLFRKLEIRDYLVQRLLLCHDLHELVSCL